MPGDVTREEFDQLAARTGFLEGEVEGEKLVVRHVLEQTRRNTEDLSALRSKVDGLDRKFDGLEGKFDVLSRKFDDLRESLPRIVGDVVRAAIEPLTRKR
jgi:hypothetical protein